MDEKEIKTMLDETIDLLSNIQDVTNCKQELEIARSFLAAILTAYKNNRIET